MTRHARVLDQHGEVMKNLDEQIGQPGAYDEDLANWRWRVDHGWFEGNRIATSIAELTSPDLTAGPIAPSPRAQRQVQLRDAIVDALTAPESIIPVYPNEDWAWCMATTRFYRSNGKHVRGCVGPHRTVWLGGELDE